MAGIECSPKIFDFRANGIPVQESVDFFDTLKRVPDKTGTRFLIFIHSFESIFSIELSFLKSISQGLLQSDQLSVSSETSPG